MSDVEDSGPIHKQARTHSDTHSANCNSSSPTMDLDLPGAFATTRSEPRHVHNANCYHRCVKDPDSGENCATAQLLNSLSAAAERFSGNGTLPKAIQQAKVTFCQGLVPPEFSNGVVNGLKIPLSRVLKVNRSFIEFAVKVRGTSTNEDMNEALRSGEDVQRAANSSRYNRLVPWNFYHRTGKNPDGSMLVELDKGQRAEWNGKPWTLGDESMKLRCKPHSRRGTIGDLVKEYRESETCRRLLFFIFAFFFELHLS